MEQALCAPGLPGPRADRPDPRALPTTCPRCASSRPSSASPRWRCHPSWSSGRGSRSRAGTRPPLRLIERGVTGIICASDPLALGAIRAARRCGLSVPRDLSVIGYDDSALMSCTDPPLTTVRQPLEAIGRAAVEMLAGQIEGSPVSADELFFEPEVVARGSTANAPGALSICKSLRTTVRKMQNSRRALALVCWLCQSRRHERDGHDGCGCPAARIRGRRTSAPGGATRSSIRSTSGASPTPTATGSATSRACGRACPTSPRSASTRCGSTRGTRRRWPMPATTSLTTASIDPAFGTLWEAEQLIAEARALGIRTIVDIVPNHVSNEHPWFREALAAPPGSPARDRFWFRPGTGPRRRAAAQRLAVDLRRSAWTRVADGEWYLHLFAPEQPDLNWEHPEVWAEHEDILRFWFERGVAGVRIDSAALLVKDPELAEERPDAGPGEHPFTDRDELHEIYRRWRAIADSYEEPRVLVGEVWLPDAERFARYLRPDELHTAFNFDFLACPWEPGADAGVDPLGARRARAGRRAGDLGALEPRRHPSRSRATAASTPASRSRPSARGRRPIWPAAGGAPGPPRCSRWRCPGRCTSTRARSSGLPEVENIPADRKQDPMWHRSGGVDPGRDGCRIPLPWSGAQRHRMASAPTARRSSGSTSQTTGRRSRSRPRPTIRSRCSALYRVGLSIRRQAPWGPRAPSWPGSTTATDVIAFTRGRSLRLHRQFRAAARRTSPRRLTFSSQAPDSMDNAYRRTPRSGSYRPETRLRSRRSQRFRSRRNACDTGPSGPRRGEIMKFKDQGEAAIRMGVTVASASRAGRGRGRRARVQPRQGEVVAGPHQRRVADSGQHAGGLQRVRQQGRASSEAANPGDQGHAPSSTSGSLRRSRRSSPRARCRQCSPSRSRTGARSARTVSSRT